MIQGQDITAVTGQIHTLHSLRQVNWLYAQNILKGHSHFLN